MKTLCYNLPVLHTLLQDDRAGSLCLFPAKALSQDQQAERNELLDRSQRRIIASQSCDL
ncbi:MAG: hypothetical protein LBD55_03965 [Treponema sp.]|nr:hypothetical protein [Treponema sp.]